MSNHIDYTKTPEEILTALINARRGTSLTASQLVFGAPQVNVGTRNTKITVTAAAGSGFTGTSTIAYDRRDIATIPGDLLRTFTPGSAVSVAQLLPLINDAYGINLSAADIVDAALPAFDGETPGETKPFTLQMDADCKIFIGSVVLNVRRQDIPLSSIIGDTDLGDIEYP